MVIYTRIMHTDEHACVRSCAYVCAPVFACDCCERFCIAGARALRVRTGTGIGIGIRYRDERTGYRVRDQRAHAWMI